MERPLGNILLVDRSDRTQPLADLLTEEGFAVSAAGDLEQAHAVLDTRLFDLVLLAWPGDSDAARAFCHRLRSVETDAPPVIALNGSDAPFDKTAALQAGAVDYLSAPYDGPGVHARLNLHLENRRLRRQLRDSLTAQEKAHKHAQRLREMLDAMRAITERLDAQQDRQGLIDIVCARLAEARGYFSAWAVLFDSQMRTIAVAQAGLEDGFAPLSRDLYAGKLPNCCLDAMSHGDAIVIENVAVVCGDCPIAMAGCSAVALAAPLVQRDRCYGVIVAGARAESIDADEVDLYGEVANDVAMVLTNLEHQYERRQVQEEMDRQQHLLEDILETTLAGYWDWRIPENTEYLSPGFKRMFGYQDHELENVPETWQRLIFSDDLPAVMARYDAHIATRGKTPFYNEVRYRHKDGSTVWVICAGRVVEWDQHGQPLRMVGCHVDITPLKKAEAQIEGLARFPAENPSPVMRVDADGAILYANDAAPDVLDAWNCRDTRQLPQAQREIVNSVLQSGEPLDVECETADGRVFSVTFVPVVDSGYVNIYGMNITERKRAQAALQERETLYRFLVENQNDLVVRFDAEFRLSYVSPSYCATFGKSEDELLGQSFVPLIHSDDRTTVQNSLAGLREPPHTTQHEERALTVDGWRWFSWAARAVMDEQGNIDSFISVGRDITEQVAAQEALAKSEENWRSMTENSPSVVLMIDLDGIIRFINRPLPPWREEHVIDRALFEFVRPDEVPFMKECFEHVRQTGRRGTFSNTYTDDDRSVTCYEFHVGPIRRDGEVVAFTVIGSDITERRQAEMALRHSEERYRLLFNAGNDAIFVNGFTEEDDLGTFFEVNQLACERFGYSRAEYLKLTPYDMVSPDVPVDDAALQGELRQQGHVVFEHVLRTRAGEDVPVEISAHRFELAGRPLLLSVARDITERKRIQEMILQSEKMKMIGGLAAGVAHEINNPLAGIVQSAQNVEMLLDPQRPRNQETARTLGLDLEVMLDYLRRRGVIDSISGIRQAGLRASGTIRNMLRFSRSLKRRMVTADLADIIDDAIELARHDLDLKGRLDDGKIEITRRYAPDVPAIQCAPAELQQVVLNLLANAVHALSDQSDPAPEIVISTTAEDGLARFDVADNGPGMTEEVRKSVFEPFFTSKEAGAGTGLGLFVSYFIVTTNHGGAIQVESAPGKGARFTVSIPIEEETQ